MRKLVIIGCGMATARLLRELVAQGHDYRIEVFGEEPGPGYNRVLLSALLAGERSEADLELLATGWYAANDIVLHTGESVVRVNTTGKQVHSSKGRISDYDILVFATGSLPAWPELAGSNSQGVLAFRKQEDLHAIRAATAGCNHAVVLGGGLLGLEAAHGLRRLGLRVTVLHRQQWLMNRQLDRAAASVLQQRLEQQGIHFELGRNAAALRTHEGSIRGLQLDDGRELECQLLLVATGVVPNSALARAAGLTCDKGILVDEQMQTHTPGVYALGECCQHEDRLYGLVAPVHEQASVLAAHLCGQSASYRHRESPVHLKIAGVPLVSAGTLPFPADSHSQLLRDPARGIYRRLVFQGERLCGFVLVGDQRNAAWYQQLLEQGTTVSAAKPWLMFGEQPGASAQQEALHANH